MLAAKWAKLTGMFATAGLCPAHREQDEEGESYGEVNVDLMVRAALMTFNDC